MAMAGAFRQKAGNAPADSENPLPFRQSISISEDIGGRPCR